MIIQPKPPAITQNPNLTPSDDDLGVLRHLYLSWCDKLDKKPMRHYERLSVDQLKHYNQIMAWQVTHDTRMNDMVIFDHCGQVRIGQIIGFDKAHLNSIGVRKGQLVATIAGGKAVYTYHVGRIRKVGLPKQGMVAVYKYPYIQKVTQYGDRMDYKTYDVRRMDETREARWMSLFDTQGVTVTVPDGFFNTQMKVLILGG